MPEVAIAPPSEVKPVTQKEETKEEQVPVIRQTPVVKQAEKWVPKEVVTKPKEEVVVTFKHREVIQVETIEIEKEAEPLVDDDEEEDQVMDMPMIQEDSD